MTRQQPEPREITMTAVDGTDALAFVIVRPGQNPGSVEIEAAAHGMSKPEAAHVLRQVAAMFDQEGAAEARRE